MSTKGIIALSSGGLDSVVMTHLLMRDHERVLPVFVDYNHKAGEQERHAFRHFFPEPTGWVLEVDTSPAFKAGHWVMKGSTDPQFPLAYRSVENEYIPARNILILSLLLPHCILAGFDTVATGNLGADWTPDNNPEFFLLYSQMVKKGTPLKDFSIVTPVNKREKWELVREGIRMGLALEHTFSCYDDSGPVGEHCGMCHQCMARKDAFQLAKVQDKTKYRGGV